MKKRKKEKTKQSIDIDAWLTVPRVAGSQDEAHGGPPAISGLRRRHQAADQQSDSTVGGESRAAPLRAIPPAVLHGQFAERRATQSEGKRLYAPTPRRRHARNHATPRIERIFYSRDRASAIVASVIGW